MMNAEAHFLAQTLRIETLDRSGRWYLTPGSRSIYDLRVRNDAKDATDCSIVVEDPASGVTVDPPTFRLRGHEVRTVTVLFSENANARTQRVLMKLCDDSGAELASFEHPLIVTGGTDCSLALAFKDVIVEDGQLQGFALQCTVRSQSEAPCAFALSMTPHPALSAPDLPAVQLEPGAGADVIIPVRWEQSKKDEGGQNHPVLLEFSVPVSNGKRITRMRWDLFAQQLAAVKSQPKTDSASAMGAATPSARVAPPASEAKAPAASALVSEEPKKSVSAPATNGQPPSAPKRTAPTAPPKPALIAVAEKPVTPLLMLSGQIALKCLPNPVTASNGVATKAAAANGAATVTKLEPAPSAPPAKTNLPVAAAIADVIELPLFADLGTVTPPKETAAKTEAVAKAEPIARIEPAPSAPAKVVESPAQQSAPVKAPSAPAPEAPAKPQPVVGAAAATQSAPAPAKPASSTWAAVIMPVAAIAAETATPADAAPKKPAAPATPAQAAPAQPAAAQQPVKTESVAPAQANAASAPTTTPAAGSTTAAQPTAPAPKLTPYTPARWNAEDAAMAASVVAPAPQTASAPTPNAASTLTPAPQLEDVTIAPPVRTTATLIRTRPMAATQAKRGAPTGIIIGAAAVAAIAVAAFLFKPNSTPKPTQQAVTQTSVAVATQATQSSIAATQPAPKPLRHTVTVTVTHAKPKAVVATPAAHATATPAPTATPTVAPATPRPATPKPTAQKPVASVPVHHKAPTYAPPVARPAPVQQLSQSVVALGQVEAYYGPHGHAVRVLWSAADQASANVQLIDDRGTTVSSTSVRGSRQNAVLYLPRRFHGDLTVQVSSVGRGGERVATTTSLPAFGN